VGTLRADLDGKKQLMAEAINDEVAARLLAQHMAAYS